MGITKEEFHAITWFTSWAVDADHGSDLSDVTNNSVHPQSMYVYRSHPFNTLNGRYLDGIFHFPSMLCRGCLFTIGTTCCDRGTNKNGVEDIIRSMKAVERAVIGFKCKQIIDMGRMMWLKEHGLETQFVKYVPSNISPENHLLLARWINHI